MLLMKHSWLRLWVVPFFALGILMITGCGGCSDTSTDPIAKKKEEEKKKEREKQKPNFEILEPVVLPALFPDPKEEEDESEEEKDLDPDEIAKAKRLKDARIRELFNKNRVKLGHWVTTYYQVIANNFNANGELVLQSTDAQLQPVRITGTDNFIQTSRPASLPKKEWRGLESTIFLPRRDIKTGSANISYSLQQSGSNLPMMTGALPSFNTQLLKPFEFHFVLLSNRPDAYSFVNLMDFVTVPGESSMATGDDFPNFYTVVPSRNGDPVPLPRHALNWTTIAYVLWDDFTADQLDADQQQAMLDWLHFGGQLILSGPDCLDKLQSSFLADFLPAEFKESRNLTNEDFAEINENWAVPVAKNPREKRTITISEKSPLLGITFTPHPEAKFVDNTGQIAIERQVGRGRIVATAFSLDDPPIRKWRSFNSFVNCCLLRRPAREFGRSNTSGISFSWVNDKASIFDPLVGTALRYLSRDLSNSEDGTPPSHDFVPTTVDPIPNNPWGYSPSYDTTIETEFKVKNSGETRRNRTDKWHYGGYMDDRQSGTAGWNDNSGISVAARETLKDAAGITPPSSGFVLKMIAGYLIVLIPVNYLVFRLIGRVEWAWIAAPIIAIAGAFTVAKMASLDIGFVRSNTQVGLLEIHNNYSRAHLTEYSALYTSLSTRYDVELDNITAQSMPFAANLTRRFKEQETITGVTMQRARDNRLEGFQIRSNSTGMLHTEMMLELGGNIRLVSDAQGDWTIENQSQVNVSNAGVLYRDQANRLKFCWIGEIDSESTTDTLSFETIEPDDVFGKWNSRSDVFASSERKARKIWLANTNSLRVNHLITIRAVSEFPELQDRWDEIRLGLQNRYANDAIETLLEREINFADFRAAFAMANAKTKVNVGRLFDAVVGRLELGRGEMRLLGSTDQHLGDTNFSPKSTQTDQQTLIVVHLSPAELPLARRDVNCFQDLASGRSNLDWLDEDQAEEKEDEDSGKSLDDAENGE